MVQDIYIQIFTNLDKYDERKGPFKPWMRSITVFTILKDLRKNKISFTKPLEEVIESAFHSIDFSSSDTEYILNEISKLSPGYRAVFNMYAIDGFSHKEIAETLSISVQTSKSQLSRAKNLLRKKLSRHYVINLL